jgi:hypothetical protein
VIFIGKTTHIDLSELKQVQVLLGEIEDEGAWATFLA